MKVIIWLTHSLTKKLSFKDNDKCLKELYRYESFYKISLDRSKKGQLIYQPILTTISLNQFQKKLLFKKPNLFLSFLIKFHTKNVHQMIQFR